MGFVQTIKSCMAKSFDFSGRATRSEFWWFVLTISVVHAILINLYNQPQNGFSFYLGFNLNLSIHEPWWSNLYSAVFFLPFISVFVRRAHDVGIGGDKVFAALFVVLASFTFLLKLSPTSTTQLRLLFTIGLVLFAGFLFVSLSRSHVSSNRFGPNPHSNPNEVPS